MGEISYCPIVGSKCGKTMSMKIEKDTFFLAEPFSPERDRERREFAITNALKGELKSEFREESLKIADKEPIYPAIFCDVCRMIQSSAYGIVDISGLNPNVLLELGMMLALGKPVFVLVRKGQEENLEKKLPSDIIWKRLIMYEEFIDIERDLGRQLQKRPRIEPTPALAEEIKKALVDSGSDVLGIIEKRFQELRKDFETLTERAGLMGAKVIEGRLQLSLSAEKRISEVIEKLERMEMLLGQLQDPKLAIYRGNWYFARKEYRKAVELYDWTLTLNATYYEAWVNKSAALGKLGRYEEALRYIDRAIKMKSDDEVAWVIKGAALTDLGRYEEALICLDKGIESKSGYEVAWANKGVALAKLGRYEEALTCLDKAIELRSDDETVWSHKGGVLTKLGRYEEALTCLDKAIELKSDYEDAWNNKGVTLVKLGRHGEAKGCYEKSLEIDPGNIAFLTNLSEVLLILGELGKGLMVAEEALTLAKRPQDIVALQFLYAFAYFLEGENQRAQDKQEQLTIYLKGLGKDFKVTEWDFSELYPIIQKLDAESKEKVLPLMSLVKGEISAMEYEQRIKEK